MVNNNVNDKNVPQEPVKIGSRYVGNERPTFIIAEIGNNHNGSLELAKRSVEAASKAGADAVKFQKRCLSEVFTKDMLDKPQTSSRQLGRTYGEYRDSLELSENMFVELHDLSHSLGMEFFATPFDIKSADLLQHIGMDAFKIASFDVTHSQLLEHVAKKNKPVILSTGMATTDEIDEAIQKVLNFNKNLIVLHCVSVYPTPDEDLNIGAVATLRNVYPQIPIGYSGHEIGYAPTIAAVALGACAVERHFTLDKSLPGPDHATVSLDAIEFTKMVQEIRRIELAVKDDKIYLHEKEIPHRNKHGKSLVARTFIKKGTPIVSSMLACKSPGVGIKPSLINRVTGRVAKIDLSQDTILPLDALEW